MKVVYVFLLIVFVVSINGSKCYIINNELNCNYLKL
jgi:hypothetical protein